MDLLSDRSQTLSSLSKDFMQMLHFKAKIDVNHIRALKYTTLSLTVHASMSNNKYICTLFGCGDTLDVAQYYRNLLCSGVRRRQATNNIFLRRNRRILCLATRTVALR